MAGIVIWTADVNLSVQPGLTYGRGGGGGGGFATITTQHQVSFILQVCCQSV